MLTSLIECPLALGEKEHATCANIKTMSTIFINVQLKAAKMGSKYARLEVMRS
jgi:hypothetical protein